MQVSREHARLHVAISIADNGMGCRHHGFEICGLVQLSLSLKRGPLSVKPVISWPESSNVRSLC